MYFTPLPNPGNSMSAAEQLTPLARPTQSPVTIDSNRRSCPSEGFNYPTFRLANKKTRVYLSEPFTLDCLITYRPFAVANTKGWFAAVRKIGDAQDIILSPLEELRNSFKNASEDEKGFFFPQRDLSLDIGLPTMLAFARNDTRLIAGVDNGSIYVYDTAELFSSGSDTINPLRTYNKQPGALRQIAPNPGMEPDLADVFAVVRSDGVVHLMNTMLESLGGWSTADSSAGPVVVSWSPKGKHLAIGLRSGDILTFAPNSKTTSSKHIPPAAEGRLVGLNWLGPGHTFRLTYAPQIENEGESIQQIISLDVKSGTLTVFDTLHPYTMQDRQQESHALTLPQWDEDSLNENSKVLVVVGDRASVDLEILGGHNGQWYQQSQENPLSLPLDKQTEETTLMMLDVDLTDLSNTMPIVYAYLNDGSLQAWHLEHSKPYLKMVSPAAGAGSAVPVSTDTTQDSAMDEKDAANVLTSLSGFNQPPSTSPFGAFGSGSGQQSSIFGTTPQPTSMFGQTSQPTFGQPSAFGSLASTSSTFGQPATFGSPQVTPSPFATAGSGNAFANIATQRDATNVFGSSNFVVGSSSTSPPSQLALPSDEMTREASMSDGTAPSFGGLSLGEGGGDTTDDKSKTGIFGSFGATTPMNQASSSSAFGGLIKPAQGFGAFGSFGSSASSQDKPAASAFSSPPQPTPHSAFGQASFGKPATGQPTFGQPAFGQTSFGQTGLGKPSAAPSSGGFAAFATSSASPFGPALQSNKATAPTSGGFGAFASGGVSAFGVAPKQDQQGVNSGASSFSSKSPFASDSGSSSPFGAGSSTLGSPGNAFTSPSSNFGLRGSAEATTTPQATPTRPSIGVMSPPSSPEPTRATTPSNNKPTSAFGPPAPSSSFVQQPTGFGALGVLPESSPFFKKSEDKTPTVTAFGSIGSTPVFKPLSSAPTAGPAFGSTSQLGVASKPPFSSDTSTTTSAFGATSQLGGASKSAFGSTTPTTTPTKPPASGGFSAFSGGASAFSAFAGQQSSFSELLKKGDKDEEGPEKSTSSKQDEEKLSTPSKPVSVFASLTPTKPSTAPSLSTTPKTPTPVVAKQEESTTPKEAPGGEKSGTSLSTLSVSSIGSFVDVSADKSYEEAEEEGEYEGEGDDARSFLSSDFSSGPPTDEEASDEEDQSDQGEGETADESKSKLANTLPPLPESRSPSVTPQPEVPLIEVTPSPPAESAGAAKPSSVKEESTTPPGSPSKEAKALSKSPSPTPFSTPSTPSSPSPTPFGGALGRPSTRPARSSPLAAAPVSGADEEEEEGKTTEEPVPKPSASPSPSSRLSPAREEPVKQEEEATAKRPQTPPLLSAFGGPAVGTSIPTAPAAPKPEPAKTSSFLAPSPTPSPQPVSVFAKPSDSPVVQEVLQPATFSSFTGLPVKPLASSEISQVPKTAPATPTSSPFSLPPFSLAPKATSAPQSNQATPGPSAPPFKPPVFAQGGPSPFSIAPKPSSEVQSNQTGLGPFGIKTSPSPFGLQFGQSPAGGSQPAPTLPAKPVAPSVPQPSVGVEEGLQRECVILVKVLESEFKELIEVEAEAIRERAGLSESKGGSRLKRDLGVLDKWRVNDVTTFGQTLMQFESDLVQLEDIREAFKQTLRELNSSMLKANTKREEIARFDKAKNDKEFAKMLSTRSLGPEHLESQQQLRRNIRAMRDRVQKLESHLQESKKKLSQAASGRPLIRAPTLDVINRTYRNIDMAVQQQTDEVASLTERVKRLKIKPTNTTPPSRDARLPDQPRRSIAITPHVAVTTAAALNAERSAQKLKKALLKARKEPILNKKAASAPPPMAESETPKKPPSGPGIFGSVKGPLFLIPGRAEVPLSDMNFNIPEDDFHPGSPPPPPRRGAGSNPKKHSSVPLKKTPGGTTQSPPPAAPASDFWGPLPVFNNPPLNQLAAEVKPVAAFVPLTPSTPTPVSKLGFSNPLPGGGFEACIRPPS